MLNSSYFYLIGIPPFPLLITRARFRRGGSGGKPLRTLRKIEKNSKKIRLRENPLPDVEMGFMWTRVDGLKMSTFIAELSLLSNRR